MPERTDADTYWRHEDPPDATTGPTWPAETPVEEKDPRRRHPWLFGALGALGAVPGTPLRAEDVGKGPDPDQPGGYGLPGILRRLPHQALAARDALPGPEGAFDWVAGTPPPAARQESAGSPRPLVGRLDLRDPSLRDEDLDGDWQGPEGNQVEAPPHRQPQGGGGGGGPAGPDYNSRLTDDFNERIAAMQDEAAARAQASTDTATAYGSAEEQQRNVGQQSEQEARDRGERGRAKIAEVEQLNRDYAAERIDPDRAWHDKTAVQKIATVLGGFLAGLGGGVKGATDFYNGMVDRDVALQKDEIEQHYKAGIASQNLLGSYLRTSENEGEAVDKAKATLLGAAMTEVARASAAAKGPVEQAQIAQLIADMKATRDGVLAKLAAQRAAGAGAASGQGGFLPIENGAETARLPDGTEVFIPRDGAAVKQALVGSTRAADEARGLASYMDQMPSFFTHPADFQVWHAGLRERLKSVAVLGASHLGMGSRGSVATMQAYSNAIGGPTGKETSYAGPLDYAMLAGSRAHAIKANALKFADSALQDRDAILATNNVTPGRLVTIQAHGTGEYKGQIINKQVFQAGAHSPQQGRPEQRPQQPRTTFQPTQPSR